MVVLTIWELSLSKGDSRVFVVVRIGPTRLCDPVAAHRHLVSEGPLEFVATTFEDVAMLSVATAVDADPGSARGFALLFHGCNHDGIDWFRLPEERRILEILRNRGFVGIAFNSSERHRRCWTEGDLAPLKRTVTYLRCHWAFGARPVVALGASSGGSFVTMLPRTVALQGIIAEISPGHVRERGAYPPTVFIYMKRDEHWASKVAVERTADRLRRLGGRATALPVFPFALTAEALQQRAPELLRPEEASSLSSWLATARFTDGKGFLVEDSRRSGLASALGSWVGDQPRFRGYAGLVHESLVELANAAWGQHEMTHEQVAVALDFVLADRT